MMRQRNNSRYPRRFYRGGFQRNNRNNGKATERSSDDRTIIDYSRNRDKLMILNEPGRLLPDRSFLKLKFTDPDRTRGLIASQVTNWRYINSLRLIDGTNDINGFADLNDLYTTFRVHSMKVKVEFTNPLTTPVVMVVWGSNASTSAANNTLTLSQIQNASCLPEASTCLSGTSNAAALIRCSQKVCAKKVIGPNYFRDEFSTHTAATIPTSLFYANVAFYNTAAANFGVLLPVLTTITVVVECWGRFVTL